MKRLFVVVLMGCLSLIAIAGSRTPVVEVPKLSTQVNEFGGRPGTFHFVTNEQTMTNAAELKKAFAALDALDAKLEKMKVADRDQLSGDVGQLRTFAMQVHEQSNQSAGKSAAEVESRLNEAKGKFMCGACHGHGMGMMMHRGGTGMGEKK